MAVFCEYGNEHSDSIKCGKFLDEEILASEEELRSVVLPVRTAIERVSSSSSASPSQTMQVLFTLSDTGCYGRLRGSAPSLNSHVRTMSLIILGQPSSTSFPTVIQ